MPCTHSVEMMEKWAKNGLGAISKGDLKKFHSVFRLQNNKKEKKKSLEKKSICLFGSKMSLRLFCLR